MYLTGLKVHIVTTLLPPESLAAPGAAIPHEADASQGYLDDRAIRAALPPELVAHAFRSSWVEPLRTASVVSGAVEAHAAASDAELRGFVLRRGSVLLDTIAAVSL